MRLIKPSNTTLINAILNSNVYNEIMSSETNNYKGNKTHKRTSRKKKGTIYTNNSFIYCQLSNENEQLVTALIGTTIDNQFLGFKLLQN